LPEILVPLMILLALVEGSRGAMRLVGKILFVCYITPGLAVLDVGGSARADESQFETLPARSGTFHRRHIGRLYGPKSHYAPAVQTGVYDSCWRRRVIAGRWGPEVLSKWICRDYFTYGSYYDWGYGSAPADRLPGYPWWW
jgi:hypothetical protein